MNIDKLPTPFVSDDLVSRCLEDLKKVWRHTEYEQLLEEAEVKADENAKKEAAENMRIRYDAVGNCLNDLEGAAGENKNWWEQWRKDEDKDDPLIIDPYSNIDIEWYHRNITALKVQTAIQFSIYLLKDAEQPWNAHDSAVFVSSRLIQLCYKLCEWVGIDTVLSTGGDVLVAMHLKALSLYIALHNEMAKLKEQAELFGIDLEQGKKQPRPKQKKPKPMSKEQWAEATLEQKKQDPKGKKVFTPMVCRIFDAAVRDGRFIEETPTGYRWVYNTEGVADDGTSLMYFLYKAYGQRKGIPWDALQALFGVTANLRQFLSNLKNAKDADGNERESWLTHDNPPDWGRPIKQFIDSFFRTAE